jgi:hypothetical protein
VAILVTFVILGCLLLGWIPSALYPNSESGPTKSSSFSGIGFPIGIAFLAIGGSILVFELGFAFDRTRNMIINTKLLMQHHLVKIILVLLGVLYTPITNSIFTSTLCTALTCPQGSVFSDVLDSSFQGNG